MCKIKVIYKNLNQSEKEIVIEIDRDTHPSMETPYYVVVQKEEWGLSISFAYANNTTQTEIINVHNWELSIGNNTGRVFNARLRETESQNAVVLKSYVKSLKKSNWTDLKIQNLSVGIEIINLVVNGISNQ